MASFYPAQSTDHGWAYNTNAATVDGTILKVISNTAGSITNCAIRFTNVTIPAGDVIVTAVLNFYSYHVNVDDANFKIHFYTIDDAPTIPADANWINTRPVTTAYTSYVQNSIGTGWKTSPSIVAPLQEIIDRDGWASGQDVMMMLKGNSPTGKQLQFYGYDNGSLIPELEVTWKPPGPPLTIGGAIPAKVNTIPWENIATIK